jgi:hypothetical protein
MLAHRNATAVVADPDTAVGQALPLWGPTELMYVAGGLSDTALSFPVIHALVYAALLLALSSWSWRRRVRIYR